MNNMKKILMAGTLLLVLTGCGSNDTSLTCKNEDSEAGTTAIVEAKFNEDQLTNLNTNTTIDVGLEPTEEQLTSMCENTISDEGVTCNATSNGTNIVLEYDIDLTKASEAILSEINYEDNTYEAVKKDFENIGYTCE